MSIAYLFLVLVFFNSPPTKLVLQHASRWHTDPEKSYSQETGDPQQNDFLHYILNNHACSSEAWVGPPGTRRKAATRNTPEISACMENEKRELCPSLIFLLSNYYFKHIFFIAFMI
jgi:hypothetical protein